jgi:hypothetical protein
MHTLLNARQMKLLFEAAAGTPEPATAQALRELAHLRRLGLLDFDSSGRYALTSEGRARVGAQSPALH